MIVGGTTQVVAGGSLRAHVSPASRQNPPPVDPPEVSPRPVPPSVTQEAALIPPGTKDSPASASKRYRDVLTLPLASMFTIQVGAPRL